MNLIEKSKSLLQKEVFHRSYYCDWLSDAVKSSNLIVLQWQRRVGKSFVVLDFLKTQNIQTDKIFYLNKELDIANEIENAKKLEEVFSDYEKNNWKAEYIVLDEVQDIIERENFVRAKLATKDYKIIITWSNSNLLATDLSTFLTGRYLTLQIFPFDLIEFAWFQNIPINHETLLTYIQNSWLPETFLIQQEDIRQNYLKNTMESIVLKDIVQRYLVRDSFLLEKILWFIATSQWKLITINNITNYISDKYPRWDWVSSNTIANYLGYLENSYLVNKVKRYNIRGKRILEIQDKYYINDHWIKNLFGFDPKFDIGTILEALVYNHLRKSGYEVNIWQRDDKEIDFVAKKWNEKIYIQVSYLIWDNEKTFEREFGNLEKIKDNYPKIVLSCDPLIYWNQNGIQRQSIIDFLKNIHR